MTAGPVRTMWVWADSLSAAVCDGPRCRARLTFARNCNTGSSIPFLGDLVALQTEVRTDGRGNYRQAMQVDLSTIHFANCPDRDRFQRRRR